MIDIYEMSHEEDLKNLAERSSAYKEPPVLPKPSSSGPDYVDRSMVELPLSIFAVNDTARKWPSSRCYPRTYWVKGGKRMANAPQTTDQRINYNVEPGEFITFLVLMPKLPAGEPPDALRIVILENGVAEHFVCDIPFK